MHIVSKKIWGKKNNKKIIENRIDISPLETICMKSQILFFFFF